VLALRAEWTVVLSNKTWVFTVLVGSRGARLNTALARRISYYKLHNFEAGF